MISSPHTAKASGLARARLRGIGVTVALGFAVSAGCSESTKFTEGEEEYICYGGNTGASKGGQSSQGTGGAATSGGTASAVGGAASDESGGAAGSGAGAGTFMSDAGASGFDAGGQAGGGGDATSGGKASGGGKGGGGGVTGGGGRGGAGGTAGSAQGGSGPKCGDKAVQAPEECDDGNKKSGDGCSSTCTKACETCEIGSTHPDMMFSVEDCYRNVSIVTGGPGAGVPKNELCTAFMDCARRTRCFESPDPASDTPLRLVNCYCKNEDLFECAAMGPDADDAIKNRFKAGDCKVEMEEYMGSDQGKRIVTEADQSSAALLLFTDWGVCSQECKVAVGDCRRLIAFDVQVPTPPKPTNGSISLAVTVADLFEQPVLTKWSVVGGGVLSHAAGTTTSYTCPPTAPSTAPVISVEASVGTCVKKQTVAVDCSG